MSADQDRCAEARRFREIHRAFCEGDLEALRTAGGDPALVPNGRLPETVGDCLVYAIYHSPLPFIRTLLDIGANPNPSVNDGFPPLIAALSSAQEAPGSQRRTDVHEILRLLLTHGADPNGRGINDYTPLHMAVASRDPVAVQLLLDACADPELRTRIDDCESSLELAQRIGVADIEAMLALKVAR